MYFLELHKKALIAIVSISTNTRWLSISPNIFDGVLKDLFVSMSRGTSTITTLKPPHQTKISLQGLATDFNYFIYEVTIVKSKALLTSLLDLQKFLLNSQANGLCQFFGDPLEGVEIFHSVHMRFSRRICNGFQL